MAEKGVDLDRPEEAEWPIWSGYIREAWDDLRDDRHVGDMGGMGRIYFTAIDRYAQRADLTGNDFDFFKACIRALDEEFIRYVNERQKAEAEKRRNQKR